MHRPFLLAAWLLAAIASPLAHAQDEQRRGGQRMPYAHPPWMLEQGGEVQYKPQYRPAAVAGTHRCTSVAVARALGDLVGGGMGQEMRQGEGRTRATVGGAVAGVLVGPEAGQRMDLANQGCLGEVLEIAPENARVQWAQGNRQYVAIPGEFQYLQGSYCRPFRIEVKAGGQSRATGGTACRRPDGVWVAN